jgi:hypothetical protein
MPQVMETNVPVATRALNAGRTIVLDNLSEGVLKPDIYDPALHPLYREHAGSLWRHRAALPRR